MDSVEINQFNVNSGVLEKFNRQIFCNATWHKLEVENAFSLDRDVVLRTIMKFVHPLDFIPVRYEVKGCRVSFLLKNCGDAIRKLCNQNMVVPNPGNPKLPFRIKIFLNFAKLADMKINIQANIMSILLKRHHHETGLLNLESFHKDTELVEFYTLSQPKLLFYVLHLSKSFNIKSIRLSNNDIEVLKPLEVLCGIKSLTSLDLRNNNIKDTEISYLKGLNLTDLWLDGNPICESYDEFTYPRTMKEMVGTLERLDGVNIPPKGFLPFRRNFLCTPSGHDLVDQFLEHYFTLYDSQNRSTLEDIYHKSALFSMCSTYLAQQSTSMTARLTPYKKYSRNIKMMSDFSKNDEYLFRGTNITKLLVLLPMTEHDPLTFTVDLMSYTEKTAVLVVSGVFREPSESLLQADRLLGFSRTFVLFATSPKEYKIINEQMHVTNANTAQAARAFKQTRIPKSWTIRIPKPQNPKEQSEITEAFASLTGLNLEWAIKCLEECQYDLKDALILFAKLFKNDKIPENGFKPS